tara:strand:+ start:150 stop:551 length:402 start_codon:yes stop_codon:yes gene_type:complete
VIVLFACVENSCRSQIAEALAKIISPYKFDFYSAGSKPSGIINPMAIKLLNSQGVYLTDQRSKDVSEFINIKIDYLILMGCGDECPNLVAEKRIEWDIPDPKNMEEPEFLNVIENIKGKVKKLIKTIDNEHSL